MKNAIGYLGCGLYAAFVLYFVYLILRRLLRAFRESCTLDNFMLALCLAQAVLRPARRREPIDSLPVRHRRSQRRNAA